MPRPPLIVDAAADLARDLIHEGRSASEIARELTPIVGHRISDRTVKRWAKDQGMRLTGGTKRKLTVRRETTIATDPDVGSALVQKFMGFLGHLDAIAAGERESDRERRLAAEAGAQNALLAMIEFGVRITEEAEAEDEDE